MDVNRAMEYIEDFLEELEDADEDSRTEVSSLEIPMETIIKLNKRIEVSTEGNKLTLERSPGNAARYACSL